MNAVNGEEQDLALARAAATMVTGTLRIKDNDRLVVVCDAESNRIAIAITQAAEETGALVTVARLDELRSMSSEREVARPHKALPDALRRAMLAAQVSVYIASDPDGEVAMVDQLLDVVGACGVRHAHAPGLSPAAFTRGMRLEQEKLETWGNGMRRLLEPARDVKVESAVGTDLRATFTGECRWAQHLSGPSSGKWVRLPVGALSAIPETLEGVFVANASLGRPTFGVSGLLADSPIRIFVDHGRVVNVEALDASMQPELDALFLRVPALHRVGAVTIGINIGIDGPTGQSQVDENLPGLHLFLGDPSARVSGADWLPRASLAACGSGARVLVDGHIAIEQGRIVRVG